MTWLLPYVGLILGLALIVYAFLAYSGSAAVAGLPATMRRPGDPLWLTGLMLIGVALLLGWVGYTFSIQLQIVRILLAVVGIVVLGLAWPRNTTSPTP